LTYIVLAALSGLVWGTGDFAGGKAAQRVPALWVTVVSKAAGLPLLVLVLLVIGAPVHPVSMAWGAGAGVFGMIALTLFYRALAGGAMAIVAPVSAVTSALVPLVAGLLFGERPGVVRLVGAGCAVLAIALVSIVPAHPSAAPSAEAATSPARSRLVALALAAGVGFGLFFVFLDRADTAADGDAGLWPVLAAHLAALVLGAMLLLRGSGRLELSDRRNVALIVGAGVLDLAANVLYVIAVTGGLLSIVAPIASLYPVTTVLLAMLIDRERIRPIQVAGLGLAVTALVLVAS
jgi:drug/metabolite transporter (DMT)-like permease